jgi:phosphoglycerate dehydrogenase-like enzyme
MTSGILGASGIGRILAETLAMRNIVVVVLDIQAMQSEHRTSACALRFMI